MDERENRFVCFDRLIFDYIKIKKVVVGGKKMARSLRAICFFCYVDDDATLENERIKRECISDEEFFCVRVLMAFQLLICKSITRAKVNENIINKTPSATLYYYSDVFMHSIVIIILFRPPVVVGRVEFTSN